MKPFFQCFLPFLIIICLLAACGPISVTIPAAPPAANRPSAPTRTPSAQDPVPRRAVNDPCPSDLKNIPGCFTPRALRVAYGVESLTEQGFTGKGQTVVDIVSFGSPILQQDMDIFDKQFGLPSIHVQVIAPINKPEYDPNHDKSSWAGETELDVQIIHAIAPGANIVLEQAKDNYDEALISALNDAINNNRDLIDRGRPEEETVRLG